MIVQDQISLCPNVKCTQDIQCITNQCMNGVCSEQTIDCVKNMSTHEYQSNRCRGLPCNEDAQCHSGYCDVNTLRCSLLQTSQSYSSKTINSTGQSIIIFGVSISAFLVLICTAFLCFRKYKRQKLYLKKGPVNHTEMSSVASLDERQSSQQYQEGPEIQMSELKELHDGQYAFPVMDLGKVLQVDEQANQTLQIAI
ncbi:hypothetical protein FGO68_gene13803 [Halteria grandinella]|uniref:Uncharacterized protein n=1 Tax=Halteria grandinella TaxID=5974 RepID=A0A8J8NZY0_HALGN|nr:hypothetical protein FGO68_gene13803 [Halteria grandinella]